MDSESDNLTRPTVTEILLERPSMVPGRHIRPDQRPDAADSITVPSVGGSEAD